MLHSAPDTTGISFYLVIKDCSVVQFKEISHKFLFVLLKIFLGGEWGKDIFQHAFGSRWFS